MVLNADSTVPGDVTPTIENPAALAGDAPDVDMRDSPVFANVRGGSLGELPADAGMLTPMKPSDLVHSLVNSIQFDTEYVSKQEGVRRILIDAIKEELPWQIVWMVGRVVTPHAARASGLSGWCRSKNIYVSKTPVSRTFVSWKDCFDDLDDPCFAFHEVHKKLLRWIRNLAVQLVPQSDQFTAPIPAEDTVYGPNEERPGVAKLCDEYSASVDIDFREN